MLGVKYLRVRNRQIRNNREMVMSTEYPYLIGTLTTYSDKHTWEEVYDNLINVENVAEWKIGKAEGYRCFCVWYGALEDIREWDFDDNMHLDIQKNMKQMAEFSLTQLSEGNLRAIEEH